MKSILAEIKVWCKFCPHFGNTASHERAPWKHRHAALSALTGERSSGDTWRSAAGPKAQYTELSWNSKFLPYPKPVTSLFTLPPRDQGLKPLATTNFLMYKIIIYKIKTSLKVTPKSHWHRNDHMIQKEGRKHFRDLF